MHDILDPVKPGELRNALRSIHSWAQGKNIFDIVRAARTHWKVEAAFAYRFISLAVKLGAC